MEGNDILHEIKLELLHILSMSLTPQKLLPCGKEIFKRDDSIVSMIKSNAGHGSKEEASTHTHTNTASFGKSEGRISGVVQILSDIAEGP